MDINPQELEKWTAVLWSIGWKGLIVFSVIYYKEVITYLLKAIIDLIFWRK